MTWTLGPVFLCLAKMNVYFKGWRKYAVPHASNSFSYSVASLVESRMEKTTEELELLKLKAGPWKLVPRCCSELCKSDISVSTLSHFKILAFLCCLFIYFCFTYAILWLRIPFYCFIRRNNALALLFLLLK